MIFLENMVLFDKFDCKFDLFTDASFSNTFNLTIISFVVFSLNRGDKQDTRGTAFVVYEDIFDAKNAVDHLSGFNVCGRYLVVLYYQQSKMMKNADNDRKQREIDEMKAKLAARNQA